MPIVYRHQNWFSQVRGVSPESLAVRAWSVAQGRVFAPDEVEYAAKACVLGQTVVRQLFGEANPVGETIPVQKLPCDVMPTGVPTGAVTSVPVRPWGLTRVCER